ncbi:MAG: bifunctional diaminohydroxyphosphoribosylaminopyrimidine deaminase/5-amino-6-(5-phosphoribosylamino)uracil reductase RibD [Bacteroidota bacterium]|nr:bifunctional diaminohydroxyphosphoribosylaminopyrimidine deaminase/5-amino-6-(5-phosphoribosylamino)uracil reductase RibD [Bacteroidota bacterium]
MQRCIQLAGLGMGNVIPNPMVGAVLVHNDRIIGEGYHEQYGFAHAEVACINSVKPKDEALLSTSTLYVSLEPCAHWGKTPPCADLIIQKNIPRVVIGCRDPFEKVDGKGIEKLEAAGVKVTVNICGKECEKLNKRFFTFHIKQRPYIIVKWAQTSDAKMAAADENRLLISNEITNLLVHKWRSEEASILVGTNTALRDNPKLDNRFWSGKTPVRMVLDTKLRLPKSLHLFDNTKRTIVFTYEQQKEEEKVLYFQINKQKNIAAAISDACYQLNIQSVLVEGGAQLLKAFIDAGLWDEARIINNETLTIGEGLYVPSLHHHQLVKTETFFSDKIQYFIREGKSIL